jgi:hydroxycarboxylate dehydrogenase B
MCSSVWGSVPEAARRVAVSLVDANLAGHDSHGVNRVPLYTEWIRSGAISPNQSLKRAVDRPALAVVDAGYGFGQTIAPLAVALGIEKPRRWVFPRSPSATLAIGRVDEWGEMAAAESLISIHFLPRALSRR